MSEGRIQKQSPARKVSGSLPDLQDQLAKARGHLERRQWRDAERIYRSVLAAEPEHFEASHLLGVVFLQRGESEEANRQLSLAIQINPGAAAPYNNRGNALQDLDLLNEALASYDKAIALNPSYAEAFNNRGIALKRLNRLQDALASYDKAITLKADYYQAFNNRAITLKHLKRFEEALASCDTAIALKPDYAEAFDNRGNVLTELNRYEEALASHDKAIALRPNYAEAFSNRGAALKFLRRFPEALESAEKALALKPDYAEALSNRANALHELLRLDEALASHEMAIALRPGFDEALQNRAHTKLLLGLMQSGWVDYENRWKSKRFAYKRPNLDAPHWTGENLNGRSILIYSEQGIGDSLQVCRYLPLLAERGATVTFLVPTHLHRILESLGARIRFISSLPAGEIFDFQCALMSLPYRFQSTLATIPSTHPYLFADPELVEHWRGRIGAKGFKIGVCWQSKPVGAGRSFKLRELEAMSRIDGVRLISIQKNYGLDQLASLPDGMKVETLGDDFDERPDAFLDTAAVMQHLDLIISSDTSVAHLAGALGRPTWVALKFVPDWRWLVNRSDSPWYPSMRLFRQPAPADWFGLFAEMTAELKKLVPARPAKRKSAARRAKS
jgi:tetratricopeptide (TPR) repeat protein